MLQPPGSSGARPAARGRRKTAISPDDMVRKLSKKPENRKCCDCGTKLPNAVNLAIPCFICITCSGVHRELVNSKVKGIQASVFSEAEANHLASTDNEQVNALYLARYQPHTERLRRPVDNTDLPLLKAWILKKYREKAWYAGDGSAPPAPTPAVGRGLAGSMRQPTVANIPPRKPAAAAPVDLFGGFETPAPEAPQQQQQQQQSWDAFGGSSNNNRASVFPADFGSSQTQQMQQQQPPAPPPSNNQFGGFNATFPGQQPPQHPPQHQQFGNFPTQNNGQQQQATPSKQQQQFGSFPQQPPQPQQQFGSFPHQQVQQQQPPQQQFGSFPQQSPPPGQQQHQPPPPQQQQQFGSFPQQQQLQPPPQQQQQQFGSFPAQQPPPQQQQFGSFPAPNQQPPAAQQPQQQSGQFAAFPPQQQQQLAQGSPQGIVPPQQGLQQQQAPPPPQQMGGQSPQNGDFGSFREGVPPTNGTIPGNMQQQHTMNGGMPQMNGGMPRMENMPQQQQQQPAATEPPKDKFDAFDSLQVTPTADVGSALPNSEPTALSVSEPTPPLDSSNVKPTQQVARFEAGQQAFYRSAAYAGRADIVKVHLDDDLQPFYTISVQGKEKQTDDGHLSDYYPVQSDIQQKLGELSEGQLQEVLNFMAGLAVSPMNAPVPPAPAAPEMVQSASSSQPNFGMTSNNSIPSMSTPIPSNPMPESASVISAISEPKGTGMMSSSASIASEVKPPMSSSASIASDLAASPTPQSQPPPSSPQETTMTSNSGMSMPPPGEGGGFGGIPSPPGDVSNKMGAANALPVAPSLQSTQATTSPPQMTQQLNQAQGQMSMMPPQQHQIQQQPQQQVMQATTSPPQMTQQLNPAQGQMSMMPPQQQQQGQIQQQQPQQQLMQGQQAMPPQQMTMQPPQPSNNMKPQMQGQAAQFGQPMQQHAAVNGQPQPLQQPHPGQPQQQQFSYNPQQQMPTQQNPGMGMMTGPPGMPQQGFQQQLPQHQQMGNPQMMQQQQMGNPQMVQHQQMGQPQQQPPMGQMNPQMMPPQAVQSGQQPTMSPTSPKGNPFDIY